MADSSQLIWTQPDWLAEVNNWLEAVLEQQGIQITAVEVTSHLFHI